MTSWLLALGLGISTLQAETPESLALLDVSVIPMDRERVLEHQTLLIQGSRIRYIGPEAGVRLTPETLRIDGRGQFVIPGLFDMHAHLLSDDRIADEHGADELLVMVTRGVTSARLMIGRPQHLELRREIAAGALLGPNLTVASPQLAGRSFGRLFNGRAVTDADQAKQAVREFASMGYDAVKLTFWITPEVYDAVQRTAQLLGLPVVGHVGPQVGLERALEAGQQIEHLDQALELLLPEDLRDEGLSGIGIWQREHWEHIGSYDAEGIEPLAERIAAAGVWSTPTNAFLVSSFGRQRSEAEIDASPDAAFVSPSVRTDLLSNRERFWSAPPPAQARARFVALRHDLIAALDQAGARLMAGSDCPEWMLLWGFSLHRELESLVEAGLSPYRALESATRNPAEYLGELDEVGTVERGKRADLVLLGSNPLENIANTRDIQGVCLGGRWLSADELSELTEGARQRLSAAPLREN